MPYSAYSSLNASNSSCKYPCFIAVSFSRMRNVAPSSSSPVNLSEPCPALAPAANALKSPRVIIIANITAIWATNALIFLPIAFLLYLFYYKTSTGETSLFEIMRKKYRSRRCKGFFTLSFMHYKPQTAFSCAFKHKQAALRMV